VEEAIAYVTGGLSSNEQERIGRHLSLCDACLQEVMEHRTLEVMLTPEGEVPLPSALRAKTEMLWQPPQPTVSRLVIQRLKKEFVQTLALVEQFLVEPIVRVVAVPMPQPAVRGDTSVLVVRIEAGEPTIEATLRQPASGEVTLTLTFRDAEQRPVQATPVELRRRGRLIFAAETDALGVLDISGLDLGPGTYEVQCPTIPLAFALEIRGADAPS
jgi:hypothetical protein